LGRGDVCREKNMCRLQINKFKIEGLFLVLMAVSFSGYADDVEVSIEEALQFYQSGDYQEAVENLNYATQLIQQMKGEGLEVFLPEPLEGWTAQAAVSQAAGAAMFGGGITAEREYRKNSSSISIQIITDSPMMQGMMMMFSNPALATSDGGKLERIGRQKAIVKYDTSNKVGEITIVVVNRFLVLIKGRDVTKEEIAEYANAVDYKKLKSF